MFDNQQPNNLKISSFAGNKDRDRRRVVRKDLGSILQENRNDFRCRMLTGDHQGRSSLFILDSQMSCIKREESNDLCVVSKTCNHERRQSLCVSAHRTDSNSSLSFAFRKQQTNDVDVSEMTCDKQRGLSMFVYRSESCIVIKEQLNHLCVASR